MNLKDLTRTVADQADVTPNQARAVIDALSTTLIDRLTDGDVLRLPDLGTFTTRLRSERTITGPIGGGKLVPAHRVVVFRPSTRLKAAVK